MILHFNGEAAAFSRPLTAEPTSPKAESSPSQMSNLIEVQQKEFDMNNIPGWMIWFGFISIAGLLYYIATRLDEILKILRNQNTH